MKPIAGPVAAPLPNPQLLRAPFRPRFWGNLPQNLYGGRSVARLRWVGQNWRWRFKRLLPAPAPVTGGP